MTESLVQAKAMAAKALLIDDQLAEAHASIATISHDSWDWNTAKKHFDKALVLNPNYAQARQWYSEFLSNLGKFDQGIEEAKKARELDPLSYAPNLILGVSYYKARRYGEALESLKSTRERFPNYGITYFYMAVSHLQMGHFDKSITVFKEGIRAAPNTVELNAILVYAYAKAGKEEEAVKLSKEMLEASRQRYIPAIAIATMYVGLNEFDKAFEWFEKSYQQHNWQLSFLAVDPLFDPIRKDPRYIELLNKIGNNEIINTR